MTVAEAMATRQDVVVNPDGSAAPAGIELPGLPEGVLAVGLRVPVEGEFMWGGDGPSSWNKSWTFPALVVKPAPGWNFVYDITKDRYRPVRAYPAPKLILARFSVKDSHEENLVRNLQDLPGFAGFDTSEG